MFRIVALTLLVCMVHNPFTAAQDRVNDEFHDAVEHYKEGELNEAKRIFEWIVDEHSGTSRTTASYLFLGKIYKDQKRYRSAENNLTVLIERYPGSQYTDEARMTLADLYIQQGLNRPGLETLFEVITKTASVEYRMRAKHAAERLMNAFYTIAEVKAILDLNTESQLEPFLLLTLGKLQNRMGEYEQARETFYTIIQDYPGTEEHPKAQFYYESQDTQPYSDSEEDDLFCVMVDFDNPTSRRILDGVKFAFHHYNKHHVNKIGLLIKNTGRRESMIRDIFEEVRNLSTLKGILGPVFSDETEIACRVFYPLNIPIVSPTATSDLLTDNYSNFFQANPSLSMRGMVMAQYLYYVENKRQMAIIYERGTFAKDLADAFRREFTALGGSISASADYAPGTSDLEQIVTQALPLQDEIDGVYAPIGNSETGNILLQAFANGALEAQIYGNQEWYSTDGLENAQKASHNLTFTTDHFIDFRSKDYLVANSSYGDLTGKDLRRFALYGYDSADFLINASRDAGDSPNALYRVLLSGFENKGISNNTSFGKQRINRFLNIVRYRYGVFELVDRFPYQSNAGN